MDALAQLNAALAGRYDIEREIGRGGMATVYLARDVRHKRHVALKVLNPELGAILGGERFLGEIQVTANLQHPNLLPLFDSGDADGLLFYVMPFVEGESLRARLGREKQLPVNEAIRLAVSVASALDYAHRHGVIHRDLKPENILLHDGQPVVADFGIALAVSNAGGNRVTQTGISLGTPQYMSPEQATGDRAIDGRTDVYSLAAVLYEMLTGDPPHVGSTAQAIIARVLTDKPRNVRALRETVPEYVDWAIARALAKLPADRWATAREFAEALEGRTAVPRVTDAATGRAATIPGITRAERLRDMAPWLATAFGIALLAGSAGTWAMLRRTSPADLRRARFALVLGDSARLRTDLVSRLIALSPDGSQFVYVGGGGGGRLFLRSLDNLTPRPIPGTENARMAQFSPDGKWISFAVQNQLKKVPAAGGAVTTVADSVNRYSWGDGDVIVFSEGVGAGTGGLYRVSAAGGAVERLTRPDSTHREVAHTWPFVLPGATAVLFNTATGSVETSELAVLRLSDRTVIRLGIQGVNPQYVSTGQIVFGRVDGSLAAVPFDLGRLKVTGPAVTVLENVQVKGGGATEVTISRNGTLLYAQGQSAKQLVLVDRQGRAQVLRGDYQLYGDPRFSPDGKRLAIRIGRPGSWDIWIQHLASGTLTRLTHDGKSNRPEWTSDGRRVAWHVTGQKEEIRWQPWDGSGATETLVTDASAGVFSPSGKILAVTRTAPAPAIDFVFLDSARRRTTFVAQVVTNQGSPRFSSDGRWLAYVSGESGRVEVYVRPVPGPGGVHQISTDGGTEPLWGPGGREVIYRANGRVLSATLATSPEFTVVRRDTLFRDSYTAGAAYAAYDLSPDGKRFVFIKGVGDEDTPILVFGWFDELRERMALGARK
jgi:serine/threonine-protein kinase